MTLKKLRTTTFSFDLHLQKLKLKWFVIPVETGIQTCPHENREPVYKTWIPRTKCGAGSAGVYPDGNRGRNDAP